MASFFIGWGLLLSEKVKGAADRRRQAKHLKQKQTKVSKASNASNASSEQYSFRRSAENDRQPALAIFDSHSPPPSYGETLENTTNSTLESSTTYQQARGISITDQRILASRADEVEEQVELLRRGDRIEAKDMAVS
jgi:hypothetical protein